MQANTLANGAEGRTTDWNAVNWHKVERTVRNLRQRIFRASKEGDYRKVRSLQKLMLRSRANALHSVRRVTQNNMGKNTPGVDKLVVKTPKARGELVDHIRSYQPWKAKPARRVYIPKSNGKLRPLGIPTVKDRAMQAIVKNALEPYWEARFEATSYGFRPGRSCHDAISKIYLIARPRNRKKWILDADIEGAFDNINHEKLLEIIGPFPARELVRQWLKAGYMERGALQGTNSGTPQGGVISPLLANIALHGMEEALGIRYNKWGEICGRRALVRYADDYVVFCESQEDAETARQDSQDWLATRGLRLAPNKTRIVHLTKGFDFLGFNIRHYRAPQTTRTGYKLLIKPSKASVQEFRNRLKQEWMSLKGHNVGAVIKRLNPILRGWANYYKIGVSKKIFNSIYKRCVRYTKFTHPTKSREWRQSKYWGKLNPYREDRWVFGEKRTSNRYLYLLKLNWPPIERHVLVRGTASPDDPTLREYWINRKKRKINDLPTRQKYLARVQKGLCTQCRTSLFNEEELHVHHIHPKGTSGRDEWKNLRLLHYFCHQQVHRKKEWTEGA
jgi:RNA-directed DNA polymerase